jgi:hypothetical protein
MGTFPEWPETRMGTRFRSRRRQAVQWDISTIPPCNVYQANFKTVEATVPAYEQRLRQLHSVLRSVGPPDVIAFQEVSGAQSIRDVLGSLSDEYQVCSFNGFKVQRLAFAWRKSLGGSVANCQLEPTLSLPERDISQQPRPGLALTLSINGMLFACCMKDAN